MRSSSAFTTAAEAEAALSELVQEGIGRWMESRPGPRGGKPSRRFVLGDADRVDNTARQDPHDTTDIDNTPTGVTETGGIVNVSSVNTPEKTLDTSELPGCPGGDEPPLNLHANALEDRGVPVEEWGEV